jgi:hypothetical protein
MDQRRSDPLDLACLEVRASRKHGHFSFYTCIVYRGAAFVAPAVGVSRATQCKAARVDG